MCHWPCENQQSEVSTVTGLVLYTISYINGCAFKIDL